VVLEDGYLKVFDQARTLVISAKRTGNWLYTIKLGVVAPICLLTKMDDGAWKWHTRYGHLNFRALRDFGRKQMVEGMPVVDLVEQVCDGCVLGKQHRAFPQQSTFRAQKGLELIHWNLGFAVAK
jgi:hypothetical protein